LELQLQGDDLVEVFLVFSQNVFGLEPATVRVREVRIGRGERRAAARRRARNNRGDETPAEGATAEDDTNVTVTVGVASGGVAANEDGASVPLDANTQASAHTVVATTTTTTTTSSTTVDGSSTPQEQDASVGGPTRSGSPAEDPEMAVAAQMGPFTTFQQLSFSPNFPLASIANEYIIPPTYSSFLDYRRGYESEDSTQSPSDLATVQFTPPGLPLPSPLPPSRWFYRDPKGKVHGKHPFPFTIFWLVIYIH
jgi:hypothetical protein